MLSVECAGSSVNPLKMQAIHGLAGCASVIFRSEKLKNARQINCARSQLHESDVVRCGGPRLHPADLVEKVVNRCGTGDQ